jgi:hypothetical protein
LGGTVFLAFAILWLADAPVFHADAKRAEATITKLERVATDIGPGKLNIDDVPVVRFQDGPKQVEVRVANTNHPVGKFSVGQTVTVVYRAGKPEQARIPSFYEFYFGPLACGGGAACFYYLAMIFFAANRRKRNAVPTGVGPEPIGDTESGV